MRTQMSDRDTSEPPSARREGYLATAVQFSAALLRRLQTWLWPLRDVAPPSGRITPSSHQEDRRKLVAVKQVDNFSLATRVYRCALYALSDTLDDIGVSVVLLEHAKGTLHVSGDKSIDCSPVKERSDTSPPMKRRGMDDSEDEEEDLNLQEQLDRTYDSEDDDDYQPPSDEGVSTDSDSYKEGETESEQSELEEEQVEGSLLPARRSDKLPSGVTIKKSPADGISGASAADSTVKSAAGTPGEGTAEPSAEGTVQPSAGDTVQPAARGPTDPPAVVFSGQVVDAGPPSKKDSEPADQTIGQPSDGTPTDTTAEPLPQKMGDGQDGGESEHVPMIDQAKTKMPPSARTP